MFLLTILRAWDLKQVDHCSAQTIVRLWHELHVEKNIAHDFTSMIAPVTEGSYLAATKQNEIRAIAKCDRATLNIRSIAHAPDQPDAARALIRLLHEADAAPHWESIRQQPRWYYEYLMLGKTAS